MPAVVDPQSPPYSHDDEVKISFGAQGTVRTLRLNDQQLQLLDRFITASLSPETHAEFTDTEIHHVASLAAMISDVTECEPDRRDTIHHLCL